MQVDAAISQAPPHVRAHMRCSQLDRAVLVATFPVLAASIWIHGQAAIALYSAATIAALMGALISNVVFRGTVPSRCQHAASVGLILAMMLPPSVAPWRAAVAVLIGVLVSRALRARFGTYVWHPAVLAWLVATYVLPGAHGSADIRTIDQLSQVYSTASGGAESLRMVALYELPAWESTLLGKTAGGVGEVCALAILAGGFWLVYTGRLRWQAPIATLIGAALTVAIWPIRATDGSLHWLPILSTINEFPIGVTLVLYHLTGGGLLLACVFLTADSLSTPLNVRGHLLFGLGLGFLTIALRATGISPSASWWAIVVMSALVSVINRVTRRRVWGT